ncbi:iron chaperone [Emticicia fontis]
MLNNAAKNIEEYIGSFPEDVQQILEKVRAIIQTCAPEAKEDIKYAMPTFVLNGNLVHFAAFKNHIGFYPAPTGTEAFKEDLAPYKTGKGSIQFQLDEPIPYDLIKKITLFRVDENLKKAKTKSSKKKAEA